MEERQERLISETRQALDDVLQSNDPKGPYVRDEIKYSENLCELARSYPNEHTLSLGIELQHKIYLERNNKNFLWIDRIEEDTMFAMSFNA